MLSVETLNDLGADANEGVQRCMGKEEFYLNLVRTALEEDEFEQLEAAIKNNDLSRAFDRAHALKGVYGNLSLKSLYDPICEITEELRARNDIDYGPYIKKISEVLEKHKALL